MRIWKEIGVLWMVLDSVSPTASSKTAEPHTQSSTHRRKAWKSSILQSCRLISERETAFELSPFFNIIRGKSNQYSLSSRWEKDQKRKLVWAKTGAKLCSILLLCTFIVE